MAKNALEAFSTCHLPKMAHTDFWLKTWTGYTSLVGRMGVESPGSNARDEFVAVSSDNSHISNWNNTNPPLPPIAVEQNVCFRFISR